MYRLYALAFARCLCIRVRKCVLHRIVGRKSWGVEYTVKKKNKQKKEGRERKRERESKDERDRKRSFWAIEMLIRFARFLGFFVLFCECRSSAYDLLECVVRLAEERWARFLAKRTCRIIEAFFHVYSRNKTIHLKKKRS